MDTISSIGIDPFENAESITPGRGDDFLKWVLSQPWGSDASDTGDVECPCGFVMMVEVTGDLIAEYVSEAGDPWMSESRNFEPGWVLIQQTNSGLVYGHRYTSEVKAGVDFITCARIYEEWEAS